jgi:hypothetical protein
MTIRSLLSVIPALTGILGFAQSAAFAQTVPPPLFAVLLGGSEVSATGEANAGDEDGRGSATVIISATNNLCFAIVVDGIDGPTFAHIHRGAAGVNGDIVVPLTEPSAGNPGTSSGCVAVDTALLTEIQNTPSAFYVNVHTGVFPDGAVRGQLF